MEGRSRWFVAGSCRFGARRRKRAVVVTEFASEKRHWSQHLARCLGVLSVVIAAMPITSMAEFVSQPAGWHSFIVTEDGRVRDTSFKKLLEDVFDGPMGNTDLHYDDLVVVMGQCYGGGMLDDITGFLTSALMSAARHDEFSYGSPPATAAGAREGFFIREWAKAVDTAAKRNMLAAYTEARAKDPCGPVLMSYGGKYVEHPQYISSSSTYGDAIKLGDSSPAVAILFGGSANNDWNFNSLSRIHSVLTTRYGYGENDLYILYPGTTKPDGTALPAWIDDRARNQDFLEAVEWLDALTTSHSEPDVLYWNAQQHGARAKDIKLAAPAGAKKITFNLDSTFIDDFSTRDPAIIIERWLNVRYADLGPGNELLLNGVSLGALPEGEGALDLVLDPDYVVLYREGNTLEIIGSDTFDRVSVLDIGVTAQGSPASLEESSSASPEGEVTIAVVWSGTELDAFKAVIAPFEAETGIDVVIDEVGRDLPTVLPVRIAAGIPPDLAALPNPGQMKEFAEQGALVALDDLENLADHSAAFVDLGSVDGHVYGVFIAADLKSLVWYNKKALAAAGYAVPASWPALIALSDQIVADGGTPWAIGFESGAASGWPGTDWIEDIMLRTAGPDLYDQWVNHEIPWTHPAVKKAWEYFGQIVNASGYVYGGPVGALTINFGDSPSVMFDDPPGAYMHRQATFIQSFILDANPDLVPGEDYDVFAFPPISPEFGNPLLGSGDLIGVFNDTTEAKALANYLASAEAQEIWCGALGKLGINKNVDPSVYPDSITAGAAAMLAEAEIFRFDGSDLMPAAVGSGTFWTGVLDYISGIPLDTVLENIEASAIEAYGE
jgi:alpha-glucoside transport system substrate-binding protein